MEQQTVIKAKKMAELNQNQSTFAANRKEEALAKFESIPMPKEKDEEWRYTNIGKLKIEEFDLNQPKTNIETTALSQYLAEKGAILTDINTALDKYPAALNYFFRNAKVGNDKFAALNASHFNHGIFLYIPKNIEIEEPIRVKFETGGQSSIIHNIIVVESNSKIDFIEEYSNKETGQEQLNSCITEVYSNNGSKINFYHINSWTKNVYNFTNIIGTLERNSAISWVSGCFGGKLNRLVIDTIFSGQGSQANNLGIFLGKGKEHIDFTTNMHHNTENTTNDVLVDGMLRDESSSVYRGLIKIPKEGQKTNSYLANHILKLGEKTLANSIPSLKIDANDVKASHGATVGQIDEEHLFYLMSRGLSRDEAERLIIEGFFEPVIQKIPLEELRERIRGMVRR
ncbi:Fe-S cluster assembly protein SufD [Candidatus Woesearchaeota archaeon]|nr:Fe-S cluster assembly protein SufD [Candidatus Woesearchaeota archaeon]